MRNKKVVQVGESGQRYPRGTHPHAGAGRRIEHPGRDFDDLARTQLDSSNRAVGSLLDAFNTNSAPEVGVPAIVNNAVRSDMGRMNARWSSDDSSRFGSDSEDRRQVHGDHVRGGGTSRPERHRCPALAGSMADGVREEWRQSAGRPVALAAMVDERGSQAQLHGVGMTGEIECRYYGRDFTAGEMALLRALIAAEPRPTRHALSKEFCRRIGWLKPDGGLKDMMARVAMLAMHRDRDRPAATEGAAEPTQVRSSFGPETEPPLFPGPRHLLMRFARSTCGAVGRGTRRGQAVERVHRPLPLSRLQDTGRRPDALRRPRPQRLAASLCSASQPPPGGSPRATSSSGWTPASAREEPPPRR